jgi:hypothetical protein
MKEMQSSLLKSPAALWYIAASETGDGNDAALALALRLLLNAASGS